MVRIRVTLADIRDVEKDTAVNDDKEAEKRTIDGEKDEDEINTGSKDFRDFRDF